MRFWSPPGFGGREMASQSEARLSDRARPPRDVSKLFGNTSLSALMPDGFTSQRPPAGAAEGALNPRAAPLAWPQPGQPLPGEHAALPPRNERATPPARRGSLKPLPKETRNDDGVPTRHPGRRAAKPAHPCRTLGRAPGSRCHRREHWRSDSSKTPPCKCRSQRAGRYRF